MSDPARRRIRAQGSASDADAMGFVLDAPVQAGVSARLEADSDAPLARALFALPGVAQVEVADATIWVRKASAADWAALKPAVAGAIRAVLDATDVPLGTAAPAGADDPDASLLRAVTELLDRQVNPSVAAHGGHIAAERVAAGVVYLRMSGGCQGCAASSATLRQGVERTLRAALPQIAQVVDVTDHASGDSPFYARESGPSALLRRPLPPGVVAVQDGQINVDPDYLAPRLGLTPQGLRDGLRSGAVVGVTEAGTEGDLGRSRIVLRSATRAWAAEIDADGAAREVPPPRPAEAAAAREHDLASRVRAHLEGLRAEGATITYGALARALGYWMPGAIGTITRALETTMREDAVAGRPFIAALAVGRGPQGLPARGFFDLARTLSRGPQPGESEQAFHARQVALLVDGAATRADDADRTPGAEVGTRAVP